MERKKIMMWILTWLNVSAAVLNATFQLLVIYRLCSIFCTLYFLWDLFVRVVCERERECEDSRQIEG